MASIFSSAKLVLSWLGDSSPSITYALLLIERISEELSEGEQGFRDAECMKKYPEIFERELERKDGYNVCFASLDELFALPYWRRL